MTVTVEGGRPTSVALVDDHELVIAGFQQLLAEQSDFVVVYSGASLDDVLVMAPAPDLILLDIVLGDSRPATDDVQSLMARGSEVVVISGMAAPAVVCDLVRVGVASFVSKADSNDDLLEAMRAAASGGSWTTPDLAAILATDRAKPRLSDQEELALTLYASGLKLQSVARQLGVAPSTAREYIERVRAKYTAVGRPAPTKVHLRQVAFEDGILDSP